MVREHPLATSRDRLGNPHYLVHIGISLGKA
jgi:hypothetical protein